MAKRNGDFSEMYYLCIISVKCVNFFRMTTVVLKEKLPELIDICDKYKVVRLFSFGSFLTDKFNPQTSDIDLLVELEPMDPLERGEILIQIWDAFEKLFHNKVDLLTDQPIRNPYFQSAVEQTKHLIYDRSKQEIAI